MDHLLGTLASRPRAVALLLGYGAIFLVLQRRWPALTGQSFVRRGFRTDLCHSLLNQFFVAPVIVGLVGLASVVTLSLNAVTAPVVAALPLGVQLLAAIVIGDLLGYWRHRFLHTRFGWAFHAVHHSAEELDWLSNERVELGELIVSKTLQTVVLYALGFSLALIVIHSLVRRGYGLFIHANLTWSFGRLDHVFVSPIFHRWHHSTDREAINMNYATFFSCLDRAFGTFYLPPGEPARLGLVDERMPEGWLGQITYPLRNWHRIALGLR